MELMLRDKRIASDDAGNVCLNDLYDLAGRPENLQSSQWARHKRTKALRAALVDRIVCITHRPPKDVDSSVYYVAGRGGGAKTFAHPALALEYAESLNPKIGVEVKELFLRYCADEIGLANDIIDRIVEQVREDELRVQVRKDNAARNKELARQGAMAGCTARVDYAELHNSGYRGLYNGLDAEGIHKLKKLTKSQKILDHMTAAEGAANAFWATQAALKMQKERPATPEAAFQIINDAGQHTRKAMEFGGTMPEDMPVPDSISEAKKRLAVNKHLLPKT
jgi:hypothetical protein